ncbi:MAG: nucleotidyltransferase family protein [Bacteroidales bacterium]|jgi:molybdenum cofactor cytidylyltransferase|nr:nucleotidyltransferase family protein [Bacteroidales bacterium]
MTGIWAIVLAAGESRRMGSPKMLLPYNDVTIIEQVIRNLTAANVDRVVVVVGANREEIMKVTRRYDVFHCYNEDYKSGMLSSVRCGFNSLPDGCLAALIMPGDQPMTGPGEINRVISSFLESDRGLVMAACNGKRGHPLIVDMKYLEEVLSLPEEEGLRALAERHPDDVLESDTDDPSVLRDIDTQEDYMNEISKT